MSTLARAARGLALVLVAALLAVLVYHFTASGPKSAANIRLAVIWPQATKTPLSTRALRGRPAVLNFWASWCGPCKREASVLEAAAAQRRGKVAFVGIDVHDATGDARRFLDEHRITYTVVRGNDAAISVYNVIGLPETIYLDAHGHVVARTVGEVTARALTTNLARIGA